MLTRSPASKVSSSVSSNSHNTQFRRDSPEALESEQYADSAEVAGAWCWGIHTPPILRAEPWDRAFSSLSILKSHRADFFFWPSLVVTRGKMEIVSADTLQHLEILFPQARNGREKTKVSVACVRSSSVIIMDSRCHGRNGAQKAFLRGQRPACPSDGSQRFATAQR